jgi:hypothetical protein
MARIAVSIQTLADEVLARSPNTVIYFYDNGPRRDSDHDPNDYGVICACDIMQGHGLDLDALAKEIVARRHPECKYVIWNKKIASRNTRWEWVDYEGASDHTDHIHVSVGIGPDGYSRPPYDSDARWLEDIVGDIFCKYGDTNSPAVQALQIGLNTAWKDDPAYDGKDIVKVTSTYDAATAKAVYRLLSGPADGKHFNPTLYWRLMTKVIIANAIPGPQGPEGPRGPKGDQAVLGAGTVLEIRDQA